MTRSGRMACAVIVALAAVLWGISPAQAADVGYVGPSYGTSTTAPTGQKPQSKLWITDGIWWGALFDKASADFHIFRFDSVASTWTDTGVLIDERTNMYMDAMWDGQNLYVLSAGATASNTAHSPRLVRFSYETSTRTWTRDSGYPVTPMGTGGVKSPVIAKDSTGMLWATFFIAGRIWVTHSLPGDDRTWVPRYVLPTPNGESSVGSDDLSAVVAFDGDKIGVLWSNQLPASETVYWAWHQDGASDQTWSTEVAYRQPEGADDHINLKSLIGDSSGRVFAVAKTSMDAASDPLFNLLTLSLSGQWSATQIWNQADDSTRAIVQIDRENRQLYAFAAAPCCSGGTIYYKKSSLDNPSFGPGLGTAFIHSDAHPEANNPTSTKQLVNSATDLVVMASDDQTRTYVYNKLEIGPSTPDTTPPQTTITDAPTATTTSSSATFAFASSEGGSTFACALDNAPAEPCTSPRTYTGLGVGGHTFSVAASDASGNLDQSPATHGWTVEADTTPPETTITSAPAATTSATSATFAFTSGEAGSTFTCTLDGGTAQACSSPVTYSGLAPGSHTFSVLATDGAGQADPTPANHSWTIEVADVFEDDFSSGSFTAGGWDVRASSGGTAVVELGAVHADNHGARLVSTSTSGSTASIRKNFPAQGTLTTSWDGKVTVGKSGQSFTLAKIYSSSGRVFSLVRNGTAGALSIQDASSTTAIGASLPLNQAVRFTVSLAQGASGDTVRVSIDGTQVYTSTSRNLGSSGFTGLRLSDDAKRRTFEYRVDTVQVTS